MKIVKIFFLVLFLLCYSKYLCLATEQSKDILQIDNKEYFIEKSPFINYLDIFGKSIKLITLDTSNYDGYEATWKIKENKLYLVGLQARIQNGAKEETVDTSYFFHDRKLPILANWYNGEVIVTKSDTSNLIFQLILLCRLKLFYPKAYVFEIEKGIIKARKVVTSVVKEKVERKVEFVDKLEIE